MMMRTSGLEVIKLFFMSNSTGHEISTTHTIVGILTFMSRINCVQTS